MHPRVGAEARVVPAEWHGRPAVVKTRLPKTYRDPGLDQRLRTSRLRNEARLMAEARRLGIPVPILYDLDLEAATMTMALLEGSTLAELVEAGDPAVESHFTTLGEYLGLLHVAHVVHGDLTTSNMVMHRGRLHLLDFSLGDRGADVEAKGVDLHLLREALEGAHAGRADDLWEAFLKGYRGRNPQARDIEAKVRAIEARGRYARGS